MSRKPQSKYSTRAKKVMSILTKIDLGRNPKYIYSGWGDPNWSLAEAASISTPIGEVHLHWTNRRGIGSWKIVDNPQWRGEICLTARCRRVIIEPLGGANESVPLNVPALEDMGTAWWKAKYPELESFTVEEGVHYGP